MSWQVVALTLRKIQSALTGTIHPALTPDELGQDFALWSRAALSALIRRQYGVRLAGRSTGKYLARWGFSAQKPLRRAYEQQPAAVRHWLRQEYPAIVARARGDLLGR
jgi:transposase